jgi:hypothetical protein
MRSTSMPAFATTAGFATTAALAFAHLLLTGLTVRRWLVLR